MTEGGEVKIAVATMDGISLSQHFGQSKGFIVFETEGTEVVHREFRSNHHTPHAQDLCNHKGSSHQNHHQSHANVLELLSDCKVVLCGGMGAGAVQALRANGIEPILVSGIHSTEEAVSAYLNGKVISGSEACNCHH
jgi:predicted Fe-Mo cluster-binding NifX family protein